ncbi:MAG: hypothetical protein EBT93_09150, partial [Alphaproteobacteria bacterium]|nr:hypothetical protein [Alphaproteobacteria bacterium]
IEVAAALSVANAAFNAIKAGVDRGKELQEMAGTLSKFFDANEQIHEARIKNQESSNTKQLFLKKSVDEEAMELALHARDMQLKYKRIRELFIYSGEGETFREFERQRRIIRQRRYEAARALAKRNSDMIDLGVIVVGFAIAIGMIFFMIAVLR